MSGLWLELGLVLVLVLLNAAFSGTEMALVSLREGQLQRLEQRSSTGALVARLARDPNRFLATIQIGITLAGFLASAAAAVSLAEPLEEPLELPRRRRPRRSRSSWSRWCCPTSRWCSASWRPSGWPCSGPSAGRC